MQESWKYLIFTMYTIFLMILRKVYKIGEKVSNLRYSPSSPYFYKFTVGA